MRAIVASILFVGLGCASPTRIAPVVSTSSASPRLSLAIASRWIVATASGPPFRIRDRPSEPPRWVIGGYRVEHRGDGFHSALQSLAQPITAAIRTDHEWIFVTSTERYRSAEFVGNLSQINSVATGTIGRGPGRAAMISNGRIASMSSPNEGFVIDAAFSDQDHGVAIVEPGAAFLTHDGGAHWDAVSNLAGAARRVYATDTERWILTNDSATRIDGSGNSRELPLDRSPEFIESVDDEATAAREAAHDQDSAQALQSAPEHGAIDRNTVFFSGISNVFSYDLTRDEIVRVPVPNRSCHPRDAFMSDQFELICDDDPGMSLFERTPDGQWLARRGITSRSANRCVASDDGLAVACDGDCADRTTDRTRAICVQRGEDRPLSISIGSGKIVGFEGSAVVAMESVHESAVTFSDSEGVQHISEIEPHGSYERINRDTDHIDSDGRLRLTARTAEQGIGILEGRVSGTFVFHPLPPGYDALGVGGEGRATARDAHREIVQTDDDGVRWRPVEFVNGEARMQLQQSMIFGREIDNFCSVSGCRFGSFGARLGWGPIAPSRYSALGSIVQPRHVSESLPAFRCETTGATLAVAPVTLPFTFVDHSFFESSGLGALFIRESVRTGAHGIAIDATWQESNAPLFSHSHHVVFSLDRYFSNPSTESSPDTSWSISHFSSDSVVVVRCGSGPGGLASHCDLISLNERAGAHVITNIINFPSITVGNQDTRVLVTEASNISDVGELSRSQELVVLARDGAVHRDPVALATDDTDPSGTYILADEVGLVRARSDGSFLLEPIHGAPHVVRGPRNADLCGSDAQGEIAVEANSSLTIAGSSTREVHGVARYGINGSALCLRGIDGSISELARRGWLRVTPGINGITGTAQTIEGISPVRCRGQ